MGKEWVWPASEILYNLSFPPQYCGNIMKDRLLGDLLNIFWVEDRDLPHS